MSPELAIEELKSINRLGILEMKEVKAWLEKHYDLYNNTVDKLPCANRSLPCFCCDKPTGCLFKEIYLELDKHYHYQKKDHYFHKELIKYESLKADNVALKEWFKTHIDFQEYYLDHYCEENDYPNIDLKFYYGKESSRIFLLQLKGLEFKNIYDFYQVHVKLFLNDKILPEEYEAWLDNVNKMSEINT